MTDQLWRFQRESLLITAYHANGTARVAWRGVSDSREPAVFLNPALRELAERLVGLDITVDFTSLEYMNSATVSPLINFVKALDETAKHVLLIFAESDWQRIHLQCMRTIARTLRHVEVQGR